MKRKVDYTWRLAELMAASQEQGFKLGMQKRVVVRCHPQTRPQVSFRSLR